MTVAFTPAPGPPRIAALSMYDWPELQAANDALWSAIANSLRDAGVPDVPEHLTRDADLTALWTSPGLLMAQACGYPLVTSLADRVRLLATPRYRAPGCEGPFRRSAIVVHARRRADHLADLRGATCAVNDHGSDSGMNLLRASIAPLADGRPFFADVIVTGSHLASAEAVADGTADVAAIDAVAYAHLLRLRPAIANRLRLLAWTARTPGLPLIAARTVNVETIDHLRAALKAAITDPGLREARDTLLLQGFSPLPQAQYRQTLHHEERARELGYAHLQ
jgi:ABC-type phosphate/phosphonate transport system substrate-binding protein